MTVDRDEIEAWMRLPVTQWLVAQIAERCACDQAAFRNSNNWDATMKLKGRAEVMEYLNEPLKLWSAR